MNHHDCLPPEIRPDFDAGAWTCPECGDTWITEPHLPPDAAPPYFEADQSIPSAGWTRIGQPDD